MLVRVLGYFVPGSLSATLSAQPGYWPMPASVPESPLTENDKKTGCRTLMRIPLPLPRSLSLLVMLSTGVLCLLAGITGNAMAATTERTLSFRQLGVQDSAEIRGIDGTLVVPFGIRRDEIVTQARLVLHHNWSPALLPELSHLRVSLNGVLLGTVPLPRNERGQPATATFDLDPRYFTDYNHLRVQLIGHYTLECEDPAHTSLWAVVHADSALELQVEKLALPDDLGLLPAPFFDARDGRRLELPFVFAEQPGMEALRAAGVLASWLGAQAAYRGARFDARINQLPQSRHGVVFATNAAAPAGLTLAPVERPTLSVQDNPTVQGLKLLVLQGRDEGQLSQAVEALVLGRVVLGGPKAEVFELMSAPRRAAYDAPLWVPSDRPVRLGELVDHPSQLQVAGANAPPIRINLRVPPDLMPWRTAGVPLDLRYRYTTPVTRDNSQLAVSINDEFITSFRLEPRTQQAQVEQLILPLLDSDPGSLSGDIVIPAFKVGADNQLQFRFALDTYKDGPCQNATADLSRAALDPDSTIDLRAFPHYTALPNLALFANAGFPFSKYADLAETVVVLPDAPGIRDIEDFLYLMGRMGRQTGATATHVRLLAASALPPSLDADLLVIDGRRGRDLLTEWSAQLPVLLDDTRRTYRPRPATRWFSWPSFEPVPDQAASTEVQVSAAGSMAALLAFESPLQAGRSAVVLTATAPGATTLALEAMEDGGLVREIRGDTVLIRGREIASFRGDRSYHVGELPWWMAAWMFVARYPVLIVLFALLACGLIAAILHQLLWRRARRRLSGE
jgi:cellulose synthase operon protein B